MSALMKLLRNKTVEQKTLSASLRMVARHIFGCCGGESIQAMLCRLADGEYPAAFSRRVPVELVA